MFESYTHNPSQREGKTTLCVRRNGHLGFGKIMMRKLGQLTATHCDLFYDRDTGQIGIRFFQGPQLGATPIRRQSNTGYQHVSHVGFVRKYQIAPGEFQLVQSVDDMLIFERIKAVASDYEAMRQRK